MNSSLTDRQFRGFAIGAICVAAIFCYWNTLPAEFVWDDVSSVLLHEHVKDPAKLLQLFQEDQHAFGRGQGNFYRPLLSVSFMIDYALSRPAEGQEASTLLFHVTSLLWHASAGVCLFLLLARVGAPRFVLAAAPLLYVAHPLHTEAIAYISGRADPMSAAFMFGGLWCALWQRKRMAGTVLAGLCFVCGMLSKESAFIFPALLALLLVVPSRDTEGEPRYARPWTAFALSLVLLGAYAVLRMTVLNFGSDTVARDIPYLYRLVEVGQAFALYVKLIFVPTGLHMERSLVDAPSWLAAVGAVLLLACVGIALWGFLSGRTRVGIGMAWFLITWFPVSGVFPLNAPMAEHWLYVPLAGFLWALTELVWSACRAPRVRHVAVVAVYAACVVLVVMTVERNKDWRSNEALFRATLADNPGSIRIHYNLAVTYEDLLDNAPGARRHYEKVIALYKDKKAQTGETGTGQSFYADELESHLSLGRLYFAEKRYDVAGGHFATLMSLQPTDANRALLGEAALGLGQCYAATGQVDKARQVFQKALEIEPRLKRVIQQMGGVS
ncbi:MAG: tetratricopeptide repeat protein [bacterium]|nr:tetratricopeptide repeat protein [bacterium]